MAITQINNVLQKHSRWMFGIITIIIIVSFVWFFTPGTSGSIFFSGEQGAGATAAVVFGEKVKVSDIESTLSRLTLFNAVQTASDPKQSRLNLSLEDGLQFAILEKVAVKLGISVSDAMVADFIRAMPVYQTNGKFDSAKYEKFEKEKLLPNNLNALDADAAVRMRIAVMAVPSIMGALPEVTPGEIDEFSKNCLQKYSFRSVKFPVKNFEKRVKPSETELKNYYKMNASLFTIPARYQAEAVIFRYADFGKDYAPSPAAVEKFYNENKNDFMKNGKNLPFAKAKNSVVAAMKKAEQQRLAGKAAAAFREKLYQKTQDATGDRAQYVAAFRSAAAAEKAFPKAVIGWFTEQNAGQSLLRNEPALLQALVAASQRTGLTYPVKGNAGFYVAAVTEMEKSRPAKYEEVKEKVRSSCIAMKSAAAAKEAMRGLAARMAAPAADPTKLAVYAKDAEIKFHGPASVLEPGKVEPYMIALASSAKTGTLSRELELPDGVVAILVDKVDQPSAAEIAKNRMQIELIYKYNKQQAAQESLNLWLSRNIRNILLEQRTQK